MSMQTTPRRYRIEDLAELEDDFELDEGRLVPVTGASYGHGRTVVSIILLLGQFLKENPLGDLIGNDAGFILERNPDTLRCPDIAFVNAERAARQDKTKRFEGAPDLAIEVLSPESDPSDMLRKAGQFLGAGARLVWLVDPQRRQVVVYEADGNVRIAGANDHIDGGAVLPAFTAAVADMLA